MCICEYKYILLAALLCRICCLKGVRRAYNRVEILGIVLSYAQRVGYIQVLPVGCSGKVLFCNLHIRSAICGSVENVTEEISCK